MARNLSLNGIMGEDDFYTNGLPSPRFSLGERPPLKEIFKAHRHIPPYEEVEHELKGINDNISQVLGSDHPMLFKVANYIFQNGTGGKRVRPAIIFLMSRAMYAGERDDCSFRVNGQPWSLGEPSPVDDSNRRLSIEVDIPNLTERVEHAELKPTPPTRSITDLIFAPTAAAASALEAASTLVAIAPKLSPVPLPTLPKLPLPELPPLPFPTPFSYDAQFLAKRTNGITESQRRLGEIIEMIHTASLLHDDVLDSADTRRNAPSLNAVFGNKLSILAGDFLLARASVSLARLRDPTVTERISSIIEHLVKGEIMQLKPSLTVGNKTPSSTADPASPSISSPSSSSPSESSSSSSQPSFFGSNSVARSKELRADISHYLTKSYYKTASMLAHGCRSAAILGGHSLRVQELSEEYGQCIGLAFQIVDDLLDITSTSSVLGKPSFNDLSSGVVTVPILFALEQFPKETMPIIERRCSGPGDKELLLDLLRRSQAIEQTRLLAEECAASAIAAVLQLKPSRAQSALIGLVEKVLTREK